jgi:hypothetical protein
LRAQLALVQFRGQVAQLVEQRTEDAAESVSVKANFFGGPSEKLRAVPGRN